MICKVCGMEYTGDICPKCKTPSDLDYSKYDYFPHRQEIRNTTFSLTAENQTSNDRHENSTSEQNKNTEWNPEDKRPYEVCPKCGNILRGNFCGQCGFFVGAKNQNSNTSGWNGAGQGANFSQNQNNVGFPPTSPQPQTKPWVVVLVILLVIFMVIVLPILVAILSFGSIMNTVAYGIVNNEEFYFPGEDMPYYEYDENYENFEDFMDRYFEENGLNDEKTEKQEIPEDKGESVFPNGVSNKEYGKLELGMTYAEISAIIGGDGQVITKDKKDFTAAWPGEYKPNAVITVTFEDGLAVKIEQDGLF